MRDECGGAAPLARPRLPSTVYRLPSTVYRLPSTGASLRLCPSHRLTSVTDLSQPATNIRRMILVLSCAVSFVLYLHRYVWGFIKKDLADEFGWDSVTMGWLDGLFAVSYALGQIPAGILCDWFGVHMLLGSIVLLWTVALAGIAVASSLGSMATARLTFGLAQAGCYPALNKASKSWFPLSTRTTAQGWIATFFGRGGGAMSFFLFGTVLLGWLGLPWRGAVGVFAAIGLLVGVAFMLLFRNTPKEHPWSNDEEAALIVAADPAAAQAAGSRLAWSSLGRSVTLHFLFARAFASNMADVLFVNWVPLYLRTEKELDFLAAGWMSALPLLGGALGGLASGSMQSYLFRRTGSRRWARSLIGLTGKTLAAVLILASIYCRDALAVSCLFLAVKFFSDWEQPAEWGTISDIAGRSSATVFACVNTVGALGNFVAGPITGLVLQSFSGGVRITTAGWNAVFVLIAVEYLFAAGCWLFINCERTLDA
jgi:MFS transporter, ACS family, glucarate transporter